MALVRGLTLANSGTSAATGMFVTLALPAGVVSGDRLVVSIELREPPATITGWRSPAGWTLRENPTMNSGSAYVYTATYGTDVTGTSWTWDNGAGNTTSTRWAAGLLALDGSVAGAYRSSVSLAQGTSSTTFGTGSLTIASSAHLVGLVGERVTGQPAYTWPAGWTNQGTTDTGSSTNTASVSLATYNTQPASAGTYSASVTSSVASSGGFGAILAFDVAGGAPDTTAPTVPSSVTATVNSPTQITVSWTASTDAVGVASYRVRQGGVDVTGATAVTGTSFAVTGLTPSTAYSFTVSAVDAAGNRSAESTAATATTSASADTTAPTVPTGVTATATSYSSVAISWTASTDAVGVASYRIQRGGVDLTGATALGSTSFTDSSVSPSTTYSYTVSAVDAAGNRSAESSAASATTPAAPSIPPAPTPPPVVVVPDTRSMSVTVYDGAYQRLGTVPDYVSCSVTWQYLGVGPGELTVAEDDPIAPYLLAADVNVVPVVVDIGDVRWSGRVATATLEREGPPGSGQITATLVDDWTWAQRMLASQNGANGSLTGMPQFDTRTGPAVSVAADFINASATRLSVPVRASKPATDTSPSVTIAARMATLADLLTDPLKMAGVTMSAAIWLPGDPQPPDLTVTLTTPTVVFAPRVLADKPWLQWSDSMLTVGKLTFQANQPTGYRAIVGLSGQDAARVYDTYTDTVRRTAVGSFGLPEVYADASSAALGTASQDAGKQATGEASGSVAASFEVADAAPWIFGTDYVVGDMATIGVGGSTWRQRVSKVTASDDRSGGLVFTPVIGDSAPDVSRDDMMVLALARVAEGLRALQAGR